ncbi:hypothetical protein HDV05_000996 [Chytridiales sp. JEL 0842]|nr:hypothetical protein HDV05_000996 [Chytridiales sp. JEL 0842]
MDKDLKAMLKADEGFPVVGEEVRGYKRFLQVWQRKTQLPGQVVEWDVVGHAAENPAFCVVFPFFTKTKTTTLLLEYMQGINRIRYSLVAGAFDRKKHKTISDTATSELSEEAYLTGGRMVCLLPEAHEGVMEVKWCRNRFIPFLCIDPEIDPNPLPRDAEELIQLERDVTMEELDEIIVSGDMSLTGTQTIVMAKAWLQKNGML